MASLQSLAPLVLLALVLSEFVACDFIEDEDDSLKELEKPEYQSLAWRFKWSRCRTTSDCGPGFRCNGYWCYPKQMCNAHRHCSINDYCDTSDRVCKPGKRQCKSHGHCQSRYLYCKNSVCEKKECFHSYHCPSGQICQKPGVCVTYVQTCNRHRHCKVPGYICVNGLCKKRQCYRDYQCPFGHRCKRPGLCQLRRGYCLDESNCSRNQCCLKNRGTKVGMCTYHQRPGHWCDVKEKYSCPCVEGYACKQSGYWGTCVSAPTISPPQPTTVEPTEEPGSGSGDIEY